jgi:glycosyltransferase involved in cell wall biosynthesis
MVKVDVAFVTHETQRSGAPMALLNLLRWLRETTDLSFSVVLGGIEGPLAAELAELAPVAPAAEGGAELLVDARLVYANSSWSNPILTQAPAFDAPVVTHVHELRSLLAQVDPVQAGKRPRHWIAVSDQVREILLTDHPIEPDEVSVCRPFVPVAEIVELSGAGPVDWTEHGLPADARVVGAVGSLWPNKGPDLFLDMAEHLIGENPGAGDVHFVWIGGPPFLVPIIQSTIDQRQLGDRVHLLGEFRRPYQLMKALDVYVVPSRDDAFPLVALEAGVLEHCIIAFDCGGGVRELLADDRGVLVERDDVAAMSRRIVELLDDPAERRRWGVPLGRYVREQHDVAVRAPDILKVIEAHLGT